MAEPIVGRISFSGTYQQIQASAAKDLGVVGLRVAIIGVALLFMVLAFTTKNKLLLAAFLAYIVLP
jgi:hypothetical protein